MDMQKDSASTLGPMYKDYWDNDFIKSFSDGFGFDYAEPPHACYNSPTIENFFHRPFLLRIPDPIEDEYGFVISFDVGCYKPEDITVRTRADNCIIIEGKHEEINREDFSKTTKFTRRYLIPDGIDPETLTCTYTYGTLCISAPRKFKVSDRTLPITVLEKNFAHSSPPGAPQ